MSTPEKRFAVPDAVKLFNCPEESQLLGSLRPAMRNGDDLQNDGQNVVHRTAAAVVESVGRVRKIPMLRMTSGRHPLAAMAMLLKKTTTRSLELSRVAVGGVMMTTMVHPAEEAGVDRNLIVDVVFVCNPVMHHLFLGIDPFELGQAPFALATSNALRLRSDDLDLEIHSITAKS